MSVYQDTKTKKWRAVIVFYGKKYHIGTFPTQEEASKEYQRIKKIAQRIKSEERAKKVGFYERGFEIGQDIKKVCISCCHGNIQKVYDCRIQDCEYSKFRPQNKRKYNSLRRFQNDF